LEQANQIKRIKRKIKANIPGSAKVTYGRTYLPTCETGYWSIFIYVYMTGCVKCHVYFSTFVYTWSLQWFCESCLVNNRHEITSEYYTINKVWHTYYGFIDNKASKCTVNPVKYFSTFVFANESWFFLCRVLSFIFYWFGMVRRKLAIPERWQAVGMHNGSFSHRREADHFRVNH
jgi:hypothetical protein